ncbi:transcription antitermination factor NusB [Corynebacterium pseudopelargi]|uniref:transcription antitermination factor NusB n=1 Tax=Corynebacterium pseudopelargi TaxID=2080757 RepID=UPI001FE2B8BB|nr:transcription antitermination factor NusB [Corynebacterium pseudopelargi]
MSNTPNTSKRVDPRRRHGARYRARLRAVEVLYEAELRDVDPVGIADDRRALAQANVEGISSIAPYGKEIVTGVAEELDRIDELIAAHLSSNWELDRISAVDRAVLRVAIWELVFNPEVPKETAITDAVELASELSQEDSPKYINAMLDRLASRIEDVRAESDTTADEDEQPDAEQPEAEQPEAEPSEAVAAASDLAFEPSEAEQTLGVDEPEAVEAPSEQPELSQDAEDAAGASQEQQ